jgi:hypothetical protein
MAIDLLRNNENGNYFINIFTQNNFLEQADCVAPAEIEKIIMLLLL